MKIQVTQSNIDLGQRGKAKLCPVALAIKESVPDALNVVVGSVGAWWDIARATNRGYVHFSFSHDAETWIAAFDTEAPMRPVTVNLTLTATMPVS